MALTILSSNRVETLQSSLSQQLSEQPLSNPFSSEVIVVPTFAMSRWLNLRIAQQQGVAANIEYLQPGKWVWRLAAELLDEVPPEDPYSPENLGWEIFNLLPGLILQPAFSSLKKYLADDTQGVKRWQLCERIAVTFDRYQLYRPQQVCKWSDGEENHWQAILWRELISQIDLPHRAATMARLIENLANGGNSRALSERTSLFAISSLAPVFIEVIHALSEHSNITLYQHSPSAHYWADLKNQKALSRIRLQNPSQEGYYETGNELLASWGKQGQVMQDLLLDTGVSSNEIDHSVAPGQATLLQCIQQSIFELNDNQVQALADKSLSLHICHSPMRECQVLHDQLLALLKYDELRPNNPGHDDRLTAENILVMVPDISLYAPYIESVFQRDEGASRPFLAWNISDISVEDNHPLAKSFLSLLRLPDSRFTFSEVMSFLDIAQIREQFDIDQQALEDIYRLMEKARVRWGIDSNHRESFELPAQAENTWKQAWERLFAGYAILDSKRWQQIAAIDDVDSSSATSVARLRHFIDRLDSWRRRLNSPAAAGGWQIRLNQLIDEFFGSNQQDQENLQSLRDAVDGLDAVASVDFSPGLISYWLEQQLASSELPGRLFSGGVTFCGMRPMRNIPFRVICLLGMDADAFPRRDARVDFDYMNDSWQPGDPRKGDEDRYLMLETLLCARQSLYISYCGRSLKDNSKRQPSVLVQELLDFIDTVFHQGAGNDQPLSQAISRVHPMQPFASGNFNRDARSFDRYWYETATALKNKKQARPGQAWSTSPLPSAATSPMIIELFQLKRFYRHPLQYFFNSRLGIRLTDEQPVEDEEPFALQGLQKWEVSQRLANSLVAGVPIGARELLGEGLLPHGQAAFREVAEIRLKNNFLFEALTEFQNQAPERLQIDCQLDASSRLFGEIDNYYPGAGLMHYSSSQLKGKNLLSIWLDHLALCATSLLADKESSRLITAQEQVAFACVNPPDAKKLLAEYSSIFHLGTVSPLPIFPDSSYAWSQQSNPTDALVEARKSWNRNFKNAPPGESEDPYVRLALHNDIADPLQDPLFAEYASRIFQPLLNHLTAL